MAKRVCLGYEGHNCKVSLEGEHHRRLRCGQCSKERQRRQIALWETQNPDKRRAYEKKFRTGNLALIRSRDRVQSKIRRAKNPEKYRAAARAHYYRNRDARLAWARADRAKNPERYREYDAKRRADNPEKFREKNRRSYHVNSASINVRARALRKNNPARFQSYEGSKKRRKSARLARTSDRRSMLAFAADLRGAAHA